MAKKKSGAASPSGKSEVQGKVADMKIAADKQFLSKDYNGAVEQYEAAIKLLGADAPEKTDLLQRSANCYLLARKYKEAVKACTTVLDQQPSAATALKTRSKAYEALGFYKQALTDAETMIRTGDVVSEETMSTERRLKEYIAANKAKISNGEPKSGAAAAAAASNPFPYNITVKATLEEETRLLQAPIMVSYGELYEAIKAKFPGTGPFMLKYQDKEGILVTLTCRNDVQTYLTELVTQFQKQKAASVHGPKLANQLPPMKIQLVKVASEADVPKPPADEMVQPSGEAAQAKPAAVETYEVEEWLMDFARTFSDITGIDPIANHEHINLASDKLTRAVDASLSDEQAQPMFDQASEHFRDATSTSLVQWGNVNVVKAERQAQILLKEGKPLEGKAMDAILKEFEESDKKYNEALRFKAESWEAMASIGQLEWERCKIKLGYVVPSPLIEEVKGLKDADAAKAQMSEAVKGALAKLDVKKVGQGNKHIEIMGKWFDKALVAAKGEDEKKKKREEERKAEEKKAEDSKEETKEETKEGEPAASAEEPELTEEQKQQLQLSSASGNVLIMHGNIMYEWSQVLAAVGKEWKPILDTGVEKFRTAGASEQDIRAALKSHSRKDDLDLGPDPAPEVAATTEPAKEEEVKEEKAKAPEAKGLPSLEVKKKNKA